jgi:diguanylate cyclase (GGDEF)-like protein
MQILIILNVCLLISLVGCWFILRHRFILPLRRLIGDIRKVRYGQTDKLAPARCGDELGELAYEFNAIYQALDDSRENLDRAKGELEQKFVTHAEHFHRDLHRLEKIAHTDPLTGLANRAGLNQYLAFAFNRSMQCGVDLTCLMIDVDNLKTVNDKSGHEVGDRLIGFTGQLLKGCLRGEDFAARLGGDEFVVLLPGCSPNEAYLIAERIRTLFCRESWRFKTSLTVAAGPGSSRSVASEAVIAPRLSIGLASMRNNPIDAPHLLRLADESLYVAKQQGKNRVVAC